MRHREWRFFSASLVVCILLVAGAFTSCRNDELPPPAEVEKVDWIGESSGNFDDLSGEYAGLYVLNSGGVGTNETTLDYLDFQDGLYHRNIFAERNPEKLASLGDNGTDMQVHDGKLYIVVNKSNRVEILDAKTAKHLGRIEGINDCRKLAFDGSGNGYITSYLIPGRNTVEHPYGEVVRFSTADATLGQVTGRVRVGYQPEDMLFVSENKLLVTNSGVYNRPDYDTRITEVDPQGSMSVVGELSVAPNLNLLTGGRMDASPCHVWVSSRGDALGHGAGIHQMSMVRFGNEWVLRLSESKPLPVHAIDMVNLPESNDVVVMSGDYNPMNGHFSRVRVFRTSMTLTEPKWFSFQGWDELERPVCMALALGKDGKPVYYLFGDAKNYNSSGKLFCFDSTGRKIWSVRTGIIPTRIVLVKK